MAFSLRASESFKEEGEEAERSKKRADLSLLVVSLPFRAGFEASSGPEPAEPRGGEQEVQAGTHSLELAASERVGGGGGGQKEGRGRKGR